MRIALVNDWLTGMRGGEKCLEVLCRRFPDAQLFTLLHDAGSTSPIIERMDIRTSFLQKIPGVARHYRKFLPLMPSAVQRMTLPRDIDLVLSFSHAVAKSIPVPAGIPHVCYCFTPMRYAWHMRADYVAPPPGETTGSTVLSGRITRASLSAAKKLVLDSIRDWDRETSDRVTHYVAISQTIATRIREAYGRPSKIIHPPVDTEFYAPAETPREDFYLCVSALVPYKRIELAMAACQQLGRRLVIIGSGPEAESLRAQAGPLVEFRGWASNEEIRDHLRRCRALLFPGHEDFGIVPVEAQACGAPVIAYAAGGATETIVAANDRLPGSGRFFAEQSPAALAEAIAWLETHPAQFSAQLARENALRFTVENYETSLVGYLEDVLREWRPLRYDEPQVHVA
ncbi:MAG: glycosyltransferase [Planctomycetaceae bacterium]|nr:glycosyltransferase [Planctomycetaceae bacterium]